MSDERILFMVELIIHTDGNNYETLRNSICDALVGSRPFVENEIIISDDLQDANKLSIVLGESNGFGTTVEVTDSTFLANLFRDIHEAGGAGATDEYSKGWDGAVEECERIFTASTGISCLDIEE